MSRLIGSQSEAQAVHYLEGLGYSCLTTNFHSAKGEIDLIVQSKSEELIFVEVKYRRTLDDRVFESITHRKRQAIIHAAKTFLLKHKLRYSTVSFGLLVHDPIGWHWLPDAFDGE
ncbi:MAG: YraN family protein [Myxococcota bacterium]|nr:YraN family protein [Myxococcota bacterium]